MPDTFDYDNIVSEPDIKRNTIEIRFEKANTDVEVYHEMGHEVNDWEILSGVDDLGDPFPGGTGFLYLGSVHSDPMNAINLKCSISGVTCLVRFK